MGEQFDWYRHHKNRQGTKALRPLRKSDFLGTALITTSGGAAFIMTSLGIPHGLSAELLCTARISSLAVFAIGVLLNEVLTRYARKHNIK